VESSFSVPLPHPFYADHVLYHAYDWGTTLPSVRAWEFNGWQDESTSWVDGCYIHAGLSRTGPISIKGPGAADWLQSKVINSFAKFPVGSMKHAVMCNDDGLIVAHGIVERKADDEFESFAGGPPGRVPPDDVPDGVLITRLDHYLFQIAGPTSLDVLQEVTGEDLRDVGFLRFRDTEVGGRRTELGRIGMTGNLAYELHGPMADAPAIYDAVYRAGQKHGLQRLGWGTYLVNHVEGGFPQQTWTFAPAYDPDRHPEIAGFWRDVSGSVDHSDRRARTRTPVEVRWHNMARFDHDFPGRDALQAEIEDPRRTTVTLRWNVDDVLDTYASLFRSGEPFTPIDFPYSPQRWPMAHADHVLLDGRSVGWSSGTAYSSRFREVISMGCVDLDVSDIGTEVIVQWGDHGGPLKDIRATVERFPYLTEGRNSDVDVTTRSA
jgi:glycine cleavage system aminomethyltransferase T